MNFSNIIFLIKNFKYFYFNKNKIKLHKYNQEFKELKKKGVVVIKNYLPENKCQKIRAKLDDTIEKNEDKVWISKSLDQRIWQFEKFDDDVNKFLLNQNLINLIKKYENQDELRHSTTLGAKIKFVKNGKGSGGGWHRDRTFYKYKYSKAIIYLNDVDEKNGPFQYLEKSHHFMNIIKINEYLKKKSSDKWFDDEEVIRSGIKFNLKINTYSAKAGDLIIFDATGIHRGKPLNSGERYAITNYYRFDPDEELSFYNQ